MTPAFCRDFNSLLMWPMCNFINKKMVSWHWQETYCTSTGLNYPAGKLYPIETMFSVHQGNIWWNVLPSSHNDPIIFLICIIVIHPEKIVQKCNNICLPVSLVIFLRISVKLLLLQETCKLLMLSYSLILSYMLSFDEWSIDIS